MQLVGKKNGLVFRTERKANAIHLSVVEENCPGERLIKILGLLGRTCGYAC